MNNKNPRMLTTILAAILLAVTLLSNILLFSVVFRDVNQRVRDEISQRATYSMYSILPKIQVEGFARLLKNRQPSDPYYEELRMYLSTVRRVLGFKYLYTVGMDDSGQLIYVVDGKEPGQEDFSRLGDPAEVGERKGYDLVLRANDRVVQEDNNEEWGELMTVYVPIRDAQGRIIGVLGADHEMHTVLGAVRSRAMFFALWIALITLAGLAAGILGIAMVRRAEQKRLVAHNKLEEAYEDLDRNRRELAASEEMLRVLINASTESIIMVDPSGKIRDANQSLCNQVEAPLVDMVNKNVENMVGMEFDVFSRLRKEVATSKKVAHQEREDGEKLLSYTAYPVLSENGEVEKIAIYCQDIAWRRTMERQLKQSEERFRCAFESAAIGIALSGLDGKLVKVNRSFCNMLETTEEEIIGRDLTEITHPEYVENDLVLKGRLFAGEITDYHVEKLYMGTRGKKVWGIFSAAMVKDDDDQPLVAMGMIQDITDRKMMELELQLARMKADEARQIAEHTARTDFLTGISNRRAFMIELEREHNHALRDKFPIGLVLTDIDFFKKINDTHGHAAGDEVLKAFSECLEKNSRKYDIVGRLGGEEFIIALPNTDAETTLQIAERIRKSVEMMKVRVDDKDLTITASFGVSVLLPEEDTIDAAITRADHAVYRSKSTGRNRTSSNWSAQ